ncbi:hypothetical protein BD413DRAFT_480321, partial [Trametes elegans]
RETKLNRATSFQRNRTSGLWTNNPSNFFHLCGPNPSYKDHHRNPLGHVRSMGPATTDVGEEI